MNSRAAGRGLPPIRRQIDALANSKIREVSDLGMKLGGVLPLWFGESDMTTPGFIREAAKASLDKGETFYAENLGIPPLREAIAGYQSRLLGKTIAPERIVVTNSGMSALMLVIQVLLGAGDNAVITTPIWPNCIEAARIVGAEPRLVQLRMGADSDGGWSLDLDELFASVDDKTRLILINSPNNPTGWMMPVEDQRALFDFAAARGIWVIADEVYERLVYDAPRAPSFLDLAGPGDGVIAANSFSKSWCMTGWRLGWMTVPEGMAAAFGKVVEYNFSCSPVFIQRAGIAAVEGGEEFIAGIVADYRRNRDLVYQRLMGTGRVRMANPPGAFYAFMAIEGMDDSLAFARSLIENHKVGLAPGSAFGPGGEGHIRLCFAIAHDKLSEALDRLVKALG
ncbi:MAG: pyridoxal phosphate-dependent aminotransferase [Alphaproteobacteria bacterium]